MQSNRGIYYLTLGLLSILLVIWLAKPLTKMTLTWCHFHKALRDNMKTSTARLFIDTLQRKQVFSFFFFSRQVMHQWPPRCQSLIADPFAVGVSCQTNCAQARKQWFYTHERGKIEIVAPQGHSIRWDICLISLVLLLCAHAVKRLTVHVCVHVCFVLCFLCKTWSAPKLKGPVLSSCYKPSKSLLHIKHWFLAYFYDWVEVKKQNKTETI